MLTLSVIGAGGNLRAQWRGTDIRAELQGGLAVGDKIKVLLDGCDFIAVQLDPTLAESIVWVPRHSFEFTVAARESNP